MKEHEMNDFKPYADESTVLGIGNLDVENQLGVGGHDRHNRLLDAGRALRVDVPVQ